MSYPRKRPVMASGHMSNPVELVTSAQRRVRWEIRAASSTWWLWVYIMPWGHVHSAIASIIDPPESW